MSREVDAEAVVRALFVLKAVGVPSLAGRELRDGLNRGRRCWSRYSGPGFYALMAELEDSGRVVGFWQAHAVGGVTARRRCFSLPATTNKEGGASCPRT